MPSNNNVKKIRAAIAVTPTDNPAKVAEIATVIAAFTDFGSKIVGCAIPSVLDLPISAPMIGIPIPRFVMEQYEKSGLTEIQEVCHEIIGILDKGLTKNVKPEIGYIDGSLNQIVPTLASMFEVIIIPHSLKLAIKFRIRRPALDTLLIKSRKVPILFCVDTPICKRIVIAKVDSCSNFQAEQILSHIADGFSAPVYRWFPGKSIGTMLPSEAGRQELPRIPDSSEIDDESVLAEHFGTWLVVPNDVILGFLQFRKIRRILSNWEGNFLILP